MTDEREMTVRLQRCGGAACLRMPESISLDHLEAGLADAFLLMREALAERSEAVVVIVDERQLQGRVETAGAALAHGLLGLVRALAIEGRKDGWRINMLAIPPDLNAEQERAWIERLAEPSGASGTLIRLGGDHLGRLPV
jgi:NAD(P)-dependent dehydrogenase (short-subunit alcohol dehydrogenase family)